MFADLSEVFDKSSRSRCLVGGLEPCFFIVGAEVGVTLNLTALKEGAPILSFLGETEEMIEHLSSGHVLLT